MDEGGEGRERGKRDRRAPSPPIFPGQTRLCGGLFAALLPPSHLPHLLLVVSGPFILSSPPKLKPLFNG